MNCKQGDLAIVIKSASDLAWMNGIVIRCVRLAPEFISPAWESEQLYFDMSGCEVVFADDALRQLRDNPGEDETLTWAGKPEAVPA